LNLSDAVLVEKKGREPFAMLTGDQMLPAAFRTPVPFLPVLSLSGSVHHRDVAIPPYDDIQMLLQTELPPFHHEWDKKTIDKAVFRGSPTGCGWKPDTNQRLRAAYLSKTNPQLSLKEIQSYPIFHPKRANPWLDAGIVLPNAGTVRTQSVRVDPVHGIGIVNEPSLPTEQRLSMLEQSRYKYILHIDGNVYAYRLLTTLLTGSVVLRVASPYRGWLDDYLVAGTHYVPVRSDLSDINKQILWCKRHDAECRRIAQQGRDFALQARTREFMETALAKSMNTSMSNRKSMNSRSHSHSQKSMNSRSHSRSQKSMNSRSQTSISNSKSKLSCQPLLRRRRIGVFYDELRRTRKATVTPPVRESITPVRESTPPVRESTTTVDVIIKDPKSKCPKGYHVDRKDKTRCLKNKD